MANKTSSFSNQEKINLLLRLASSSQNASVKPREPDAEDQSSPITIRKKVAMNKTQQDPKSRDNYPDALKKEAVQLNNNTDAVTKIKEKYKVDSLYQNLCEKSIRGWRKDPKLNEDLDKDQAKH